MKTRAAILVELKQPLVVDEIELPPLADGQVLIKVLCSGICGSQLGEIDGVKGPDRFLPHLLGHEGAGTVLECGPGVRHVKPDDRVVLHWRKGAGMESQPPKYKWGAHSVNAGWVTTFNEYAIVSENRITPVPADLHPDAAALMGCAVLTAFGVINNNAHLKIGESIAVFGAGGIGLNMVQAAAMVSAYPIVAIDLYDNKLTLATKLGATHTINTTRVDAEMEIRSLLGPKGADVAVDNTGNVQVIEMAYRLTAATGRTVLVGVPPNESSARICTLPLHFEKVLTGSHGGEAIPDRDIPRYVRLCQCSKLDLSNLIHSRYSLCQVNDAIADMRSGAVAGRCLIEM